MLSGKICIEKRWEVLREFVLNNCASVPPMFVKEIKLDL
jgi:hypothetical protein